MSYDFNATYEPLKVYNQISEGSCLSHARGLAVVAANLMHTGQQLSWFDDGESYPQFNFVADVANWDESGWECTLAGSTYRLVEVNPNRQEFDITFPDVLTPYLDAVGFIGIGLKSTPSLGEPRNCTELPIVRPIDFDSDPQAGTFGDHAVLGVGYTDDGLLIQNSWGLSWGLKGRGVLSWEWMDRWVTDVAKTRLLPYPLEGATRAPQPFSNRKKPPMLIARRTASSPVWAITGGVRSWISSWAVLTAQGYSQADCKIIPATDACWKTVPVGTLPPGGDK